MRKVRAGHGAVKPDPAPSRWAYRFERLMLTPVFRKVLRVGLPFVATLLLGFAYFSDEDRREAFGLALIDLRAKFENRPEFMVKLMAIDGAGDEIAEDVREIVPLDFPLSSFGLDLERIRKDVIGLEAVKTASVQIANGGILQIDVVERQPVAVWRHHEGVELVDGEGVAFKALESRTARPDLPLVAGEGAVDALPEGLTLIGAAEPLKARLRGLVRIGERRWDVVLTRGQRIMLPEQHPVQALERALALDAARDLLARDIGVVDLRLAGRPTLRLSEEAVKQRRKTRAIEVGTEQE